jgi:hypothetical protein
MTAPDAKTSRARHSLQRVAADDAELAIVRQTTAAPLLQDNWPDGFDLVCGWCESQAIVENTVVDQVWDVVFRCFACSQLSATPSRPPGRAIPPNHVELPPSKDVLLTGPIQMNRVCIVSSHGVAARLRETGQRGQSFGSLVPTEQGTLELLRQTLTEVRPLLGPAADDLIPTQGRPDERSSWQRSHPLGMAIQALTSAIESGAAPTSNDVLLLTEVRSVIHFLRRWKNDPRYAALVHGLLHEYAHTFAVLATASLLEDLGNRVEFVPEQRSGTPDLRLVHGVGEFAAVEVKAPDALNGKGPLRSPDAADKLVKKAANNANRQSRDYPARIVVVCGRYATPSALALMLDAANKFLAQATRMKVHTRLRAIMGFSLQPTIADAGTSLMLSTVVAQNQGYVGKLTLQVGAIP